MIKIGEGETAEVFKIAPGRVVKLFKQDMYDEQAFQVEFETAKTIGEKTNLGPKVFDIVHVHGRTGYVMEEIQGFLFQNEIDMNPEDLEIHAHLLGKTQRTLHDCTEIGSLRKILPNMKRDFAGFFASNSHFPEEVRRWFVTLLTSLPDTAVLLHGDFMPYNMLISNGQLHVIDWAEPVLGPPMADVARTLNYIMDPTDYPDSVYTNNAQTFINHYLNAYFYKKQLDADLLHRCLLLNAVSEYSWAIESQQSDAYTLRTKNFILNNFARYGSDILISVENRGDGHD